MQEKLNTTASGKEVETAAKQKHKQTHRKERLVKKGTQHDDSSKWNQRPDTHSLSAMRRSW